MSWWCRGCCSKDEEYRAPPGPRSRLTIDQVLQRNLPPVVTPNALIALSDEGRAILLSLTGLKAQLEQDHAVTLSDHPMFTFLESYKKLLAQFDTAHTQLEGMREGAVLVAKKDGLELEAWLKQLQTDIATLSKAS